MFKKIFLPLDSVPNLDVLEIGKKYRIEATITGYEEDGVQVPFDSPMEFSELAEITSIDRELGTIGVRCVQKDIIPPTPPEVEHGFVIKSVTSMVFTDKSGNEVTRIH